MSEGVCGHTTVIVRYDWYALQNPEKGKNKGYVLDGMQTQQASLKTKDTTATKVPGRSLSRVLIEPNPV